MSALDVSEQPTLEGRVPFHWRPKVARNKQEPGLWDFAETGFPPFVPAKAGTQSSTLRDGAWIPAYAGMSGY